MIDVKETLNSAAERMEMAAMYLSPYALLLNSKFLLRRS